MENVIAQHITKTPGICGGRPCIAGHRIRVQDIVVWHEMRGYCPDEIVDMFPGITLADVYAALAYYFDHREEIEHTRKLIVTSCRAGVLRDVSNAIPARRDKSKNAKSRGHLSVPHFSIGDACVCLRTLFQESRYE